MKINITIDQEMSCVECCQSTTSYEFSTVEKYPVTTECQLPPIATNAQASQTSKALHSSESVDLDTSPRVVESVIVQKVKSEHNTETPILQQGSSFHKSNSPIICGKCNVCIIKDEQLEGIEQNNSNGDQNESGRDKTNITRPNTSEIEEDNPETEKADQELILSEQELKEEFTQMSGSGSTLESAPSEPAARAQFYHNKLLATLQILENKEETVRVQKESLEMAEQRIVSLTTRVVKLKQELDRRGLELQSLKILSNKHHEEKTNISSTTSEKVARSVANMATVAHTYSTSNAKGAASALQNIVECRKGQEVENLKKVITTLQYNLSVIEELYRECFYETAKQEELVEMLRKSYLDVRLTEKEKSEKIGNLQNVINTQKWSLEQCQDIAIDVDHLKVEISNFLNNSNNDSGMWERSDESLPTSIIDDLHAIGEQLEHLKILLKEDCLCGYEQENKRLKEVNENMNSQICVMRRRICELEAVVSENENKEQSYQEKINVKQQQLNEIQQELANTRSARIQCSECETLVLQLQEYKSLLSDRDEQLKAAQAQCDVHEANIRELKEKLNKTDLDSNEKCAMRREMAALSRQVASWHAQLRSADMLQRELADCRKQYDYLLKCYSEKSRSCKALEQALSTAEERGAKLCADSRRALEAVRSWVCQLRNQRKKQEKKISDQATLICELRCRLRESREEQSSDEPTCCRPSETESCHAARASGMGRCNEARMSETTASCSAAKSTPIPPRRTLRKKPTPPSCGHDYCKETHVRSCLDRDDEGFKRVHLIPGSLSPSEEVLERVEHLQDALRARWPRWARPHHQQPQ